MTRARELVSLLARYPSAGAGVAIIAFLIVLSIYTLVAIPYSQALDAWRGGAQWQQYPVNASPAWVNWFRSKKLPPTLRVNSRDTPVQEQRFEGARRLTIPLSFDFHYGEFPSEINLFLHAGYEQLEPFVRLTWHTPDGREIRLGGHTVSHDERISISQDWNLERRLGTLPHVGLFAVPGSNPPTVQPGRYRLEIEAILFEPGATLDASLVNYGRVYGFAGTDHERRDLMVALLWGTPIALAFGLIAAIGTTFVTLVIAAAGVWFGGWIDGLIQRVTEVSMILPLLPILVMIGTLYSTSIWIMLGVVVAFGVFSAGIKTYRAMLLPIREAPYIEAARAYGAGSARIVLRYMIPRILPVLIPGFVTLIPSYVFLEASLAVLGLGDPVLPTWGKILNDAQAQGALFYGYYYWVLEPAVLLMLTGLSFAMLGFALDRVFNPRLRMM